MKKMIPLSALLLCSLFFQYCNNEEKKNGDTQDLSVAIRELPEKRNPDTAHFVSEPVPLDSAEKAIMAYRENEALRREAFKNRSYGVAHLTEKLQEYSNTFLNGFTASRSIATNPNNNYSWRIGFVFGIARIDSVPVLNVYAIPVLVKKGKIVDYFQLKKSGSRDADLYWPDAVVRGARTTDKPDSAFVYDEGALWP